MFTKLIYSNFNAIFMIGNIETKNPDYSSITETKTTTEIATSTEASTLSSETQIQLNALSMSNYLRVDFN